MPKTIVCTLDNPMRDLPGLVLLGLTLCARGFRVLLTPVNILSDAWCADPDFFLLNYHRKNNDYQVRRILGRGLSFSVLDTEGSPYDLSLYTGILSHDASLRGRTAGVYIWGEELAHHLVDGNFYGADQVCLTGSPRHDFLHGSLADAARERSMAFLDRPDRFILITLSIGVANPRFKTAERELEDLIALSGLGREYCEGLQSEQVEIQREILDLTLKLTEDFPEVPFVIRPHPFENPTPYRELMSQRSNIHLSQEGTLDGLILRARCIVLRMGTAPLEAALASVPCLSPAWVPAKYGISKEAESVLDPCPSYEVLRERVGSVLDGAYEPPDSLKANVEDAIRKKFHLADGRAHVRVADAIEKAVRAGGGGKKRSMTGLRMWGAASKVARRGALREWRSSVKRFDAEDVRSLVASIQRLPLEDIPHLRTPVSVGPPPSVLGGVEALRPRSVLMTPRA